MAAGLSLCLATTAAYADSPGCGVMTNCGLKRTLHLLYAAATVLTILFVIVLGVAIYLYRKNKRSNLLR